ncbi:MAG: MFS transporter [Promicromonosporaceae bacterium]|nr:MFS transporter [Promicromonosporaceae bacterium]
MTLAADSTAAPRWRRNVTYFITGQQATGFGAMMVQIAVLWHLARATQSGWVLTLGIVFALAPQAIVSPFSGVLADRLPRKLLIIGSDLAIALASLALAVALIAGVEGLWFVYLASAIRSAFTGLQGPAFRAVLPQIAPESELMRLNGLGEGLGSALGIAAPLVGGVLMATVGLQAVLFIDVATAVLGAFLLARVPMRQAAGADTPGEDSLDDGFIANLRGGFTYLRNHRPAKWLIILGFGSGFFASVPMALTILLVVRAFGGHQWMLSGLEASFGAGYLIGAAAIAIIAPKMRRNRTRNLVAYMAVAAILTILVALAPSIWLLLAAMTAFSAVIACWMVPYYTFLQEQVDQESAGRVFGIQEALDAASAPVAFLIFGPLADRFSVESVLIVVGGLALAWLLAVAAIPAARRALAVFSDAPATEDAGAAAE